MENLDDLLREHHEPKKVIVCMALMKMGEFMVALSGKNGGTINSHNKGGTYTKNFAMPTNPRTIYQIGQRNKFTTFSQQWRSLTNAQRLAWIAAAPTFPYVNAVGDVKYLSGSALFNKLNINLAVIGVAPILIPPVPSGVTAVTTIVPTYVGGVVTVAYTPTPVPAGSSWLLWATPGLSPGVYFVKNKLRLVGILPATTASPDIITVLYTARFGAAAVGSKVVFGLQPMNAVTGEMGLMLEASTIVA